MTGSRGPRVRLERCEAAGSRWAVEFTRNGALTPLDVRVVEDGTALWVDRSADLHGGHELWRMYQSSMIVATARMRVASGARAGLEEALVALGDVAPWRALSQVVCNEPPNSAKRVARRVRQLIRFWDVVDRARFATRYEGAASLARFLERHLAWVLETWAPTTHGAMGERLLGAAGAMEAATQLEVRARVVERLLHVASSEDRFRPFAAVWNRPFMEEVVNRLEPREFDNVSSGYAAAMLRILTVVGHQSR